MAKLTLISSPTCPYVHRAAIALREKQVDFDIVYVDLENKPDWFLAISPLGKVPLLKIERDGLADAVIFESLVILEYIEETAPGAKLHPADPVERALHRGWMEFGSSLMSDFSKLAAAKDEAAVAGATQAMNAKLARLEQTVVGPLFAGDNFSNVDAVFAPIFFRMEALESAAQQRLTAAFPKVQAWRQAILARPSIGASVPDDFRDRYLSRLTKNGSALLAQAA